jgi:hypothetical protein
MKKISLKEFQNLGFVQEINRQFLHPRGLALSLIYDDENETYEFDGILDFRDEKDGTVFADLTTERHTEKAKTVQDALDKNTQERMKNFGWVIQPIGSKVD